MASMASSVFPLRVFHFLPPIRWIWGGCCIVRLAHPSLDEVHPVDRDPEDLPAGVFDGQRLDLLASDLQLLQSPEDPHAVVHVDHVVARGELGQALQGRGAAELRPRRTRRDLRKISWSVRTRRGGSERGSG